MAGLGSAAAVVARLESPSSTAENISLAERVNAAFKQESDEYRLCFQAQQKTSQTNQGVATNLLSIGSAVYEAFYGTINDIRAWRLLYGPSPAIFLATFGRKSVWKMQAELLGRPGRPNPGDFGDPDDPGGPDNSWGRFGPNDRAAEEYKRTIEAESGRIGVSVRISTAEPRLRD